jgi:hypothetical protein
MGRGYPRNVNLALVSETNVKTLSKIILEVAAMVSFQIDNYAYSKVKSYPKGYLHNIVKHGKSHIGRMLHYYPF